MARLLGPDANSRLAYAIVGGSLASAAGKTATIYSDSAGTILADIATYDGTQTPGAVISGSTVTVDSNSLIPKFWFPAAGTDTLYAKIGSGPVTPINADYDARLDTLTGIVDRGAWAASTAYAVNDLVQLGGELLRCTTAHTSASTFSLTNWKNLTGKPGVYNVKLYGAVGDNATDDTAAINAAVTAAVNGGTADGTYVAEVFFPPGTYVVSSATTMGGATQGNAQIPLPVIVTTGRKFVLKFRGFGDGSAFAHWQQTVGQRSGVVLRSTLTGQTADPTWGPQSVIGGPTVAVNGSGTYTNLKVVIDNITVMLPYNPSFIGIDLRYVAQATIISASTLANAGPAGSPALTTIPTDSGGLGLRMPQNGNNDCAVVFDYACEGFYYGISFGEHFTALRLAIVYGSVAVFIAGGGAVYHGATITNLNIEQCLTGIQATNGQAGAGFPLHIAQMSVESVTTDVDDSTAALRGIVHWTDPDSSHKTPVVNGAAGLKIISVHPDSKPGNVTAPGVPSSTTPLTNPFWRDAVVVVTGGTSVSAVSVDGVAQGYTATPFTVIVPTGKAIALTYTGAPAWKWTLL